MAPSTGSRHDDQHRRFFGRGEVQWCVHRGTVVPGEEPSYQSPGAPSGLLCSAVLHEGHEEYTCTSSDGQQHCPLLCQQDGGDSFSQFDGASPSSMAVVPAEGHNVTSEVSTRHKQPGSRQGVMTRSDIGRVQAGCDESLSEHVSGAWAMSGGSFCITPKPTGSVCELET